MDTSVLLGTNIISSLGAKLFRKSKMSTKYEHKEITTISKELERKEYLTHKVHEIMHIT